MAHSDQTHPKPRRPLPVFLIALTSLTAFLIVAVVIVLYTPIDPYFPPETPEKKARRFNPTNGWYALVEAGDLIEKIERHEPDDMDELFLSGWPSDPEKEAEVAQYLELAGQALAQMRKGLSAQYFLSCDLSNFSQSQPNLSEWEKLAGAVVLQAKKYEKDSNSRQALSNYTDVVRLGMMIGSDGGALYRWTGAKIERLGLEATSRLLHHYNDPETLRGALDTLQDISIREAPPSTILQWEIRMLEGSSEEFKLRVLRASTSWPPPTSDLIRIFRASSSPVPRRLPLISRIRDRFNLISHNRQTKELIDELLTIADSPTWEREKFAHISTSDPFHGLWLPVYIRWLAATRRQEAQLDGTIIALALRLYAIDHGEYPEVLDALVPTYLDSLPLDPFTDSQFVYTKGRNDFRLYGTGEDKDNDGGVPWPPYPFHLEDDWPLPEGDLIIHLPREEWAAAEAQS